MHITVERHAENHDMPRNFIAISHFNFTVTGGKTKTQISNGTAMPFFCPISGQHSAAHTARFFDQVSSALEASVVDETRAGRVLGQFVTRGEQGVALDMRLRVRLHWSRPGVPRHKTA